MALDANFSKAVLELLNEYGGYMNMAALTAEFPLAVDSVGTAHEFIVPFNAFRTIPDLVDIASQLYELGSLPRSEGRPGGTGGSLARTR